MSRIEKIQQMLTNEPNDVFLNFSLAMELAKLERTEESLTQFDRVLEIDANYIAAYFHKGKTLAAQGDDDRAREVLTAGIAKAAEVGDSHAKGEMEEFMSMM